mmetsp:Transcript_126492/g.352440  ORF Transcript_126492/g.352440 Transcript_126492/m.352440 type:complete len:730 (-) Transcript_126492:120-2309(-)
MALDGSNAHVLAEQAVGLSVDKAVVAIGGGSGECASALAPEPRTAPTGAAAAPEPTAAPMAAAVAPEPTAASGTEAAAQPAASVERGQGAEATSPAAEGAAVPPAQVAAGDSAAAASREAGQTSAQDNAATAAVTSAVVPARAAANGVIDRPGVEAAGKVTADGPVVKAHEAKTDGQGDFLQQDDASDNSDDEGPVFRCSMRRPSKRRRDGSPAQAGASVAISLKPAREVNPLEEFYHKRPAATLGRKQDKPQERDGDGQVLGGRRGRSSSSQASCGRARASSRAQGRPCVPRVLKIAGRNLADEEMERALSKEMSAEESCPYSEVDFSRNSLTSSGLGAVVRICRRCPDLRVLKLFSNRIDDKGAEAIRDILGYCQGMEEVHLSHNRFTRKGIEAIVEAADRELPRETQRPLWLRLEHNLIDHTEDLARSLERKFRSVCGREDRDRCTPRVCARGRRIHVPFLIERPKEPKGGGRGWGEGSWGGESGRDRRRDLPYTSRYDRSFHGHRHWGSRPSGHDGQDRYRSHEAYSDRDRHQGRYNDRIRERSRERSPPPRRRSGGRSEPHRLSAGSSGRPRARTSPPRPSPESKGRRLEDGDRLPRPPRVPTELQPPLPPRGATDGRVYARPPPPEAPSTSGARPQLHSGSAPRPAAGLRTNQRTSGGRGSCRSDSREDSYSSYSAEYSRDTSREPHTRLADPGNCERPSVRGGSVGVQERFKELQRFHTARW